MQDIVWFKEVDKEDVPYVGGKGANLGELTKIGAPVPPGFIVTSKAYFDSIQKTGTLDRIRGILYNVDVENPTDLQSKAIKCQEEVRKIRLDSNLELTLNRYYKELSGKKDAYVAVRSSATAEDLPEASFAGQQATFLNVKGEKELKTALLDAWASLFEARAIYYRVQQNFDHFKVGIAVPVQVMVNSQTSGIMFTLDPITNDKNKIIIEAIFGLGEMIVGGRETPDHYEVSKKDFSIISKNIVAQGKYMVRSKEGNKVLEVSKSHKEGQKLDDKYLIELAKIGRSIEKHYFFPQDIEWAYEDGKLYIVQTRPVTTIKSNEDLKKLNEATKTIDPKNLLLQGAPASPRIGSGKVVIIRDAKEIEKVQKGDVLVTEMTNPDFVPAMKKAIAIVTDRGGRTSHAAIVSRELGIACVVGTEEATKKLKDGDLVTVDGAKGVVYKGLFGAAKKDLEMSKKTLVYRQKTATHIYTNLAEPELADDIAKKNVDGIGLLRAEFLLAQIGTHPKEFIREGKQKEYVNQLVKGLTIFAKAFHPRPVIYRATDFKSNEYKNLKGGDKYEPVESNPMLGYRGAFRYIKDPDVFKLELEAIREVRENYNNLQLMIPFVRTVKELKTVKQILEEFGLFDDNKFKFYMMVEIPSNVILLDDFIDVGIDGVSIGSNDLTMLVLGTDRDNEEVAGEFYELNEAVLWSLKKIIETSKKRKITSSICGQAPSVYPQLTQMLVNWGITSISVNPDVIESTREIVHKAEHNLITSKKKS